MLSKILIIGLLILAISIVACTDASTKQQDYNKCTSVCAAVVEGETEEDSLVMLEICRNECREKFLE